MKLARHDLVAALALRYDHYSSQSMFDAACNRANLGDREQFTASDVAAFRAALAKLGDRLQRVDDRLDSLLGEAQPPQALMPTATEAAEPEPETKAASSLPAHASALAIPTPDASLPEDVATPMPSGSAKPPRVQQATTTPADAAGVPQATTMPATEPAKAGSSPQPSAMDPDDSAHATGAKVNAAESARAPQPTLPAIEPAKAGSAPQPIAMAHSAEAAPVSAPSTQSDETRIILTGIELADGDGLFLCGDRVELGNWDPDRARPMMREGAEWIAVVPRGEGSFKFLRRTEDGDVIWESGENRELGAAVQIETSWQSKPS